MTTATLRHGGLPTCTIVPRVARTTPAQGFFARLRAALAGARRLRREAVIADYVQLRGGRMMDSLERDIERRFMLGDF